MFILTKKKECIRFVEYFNDRLMTLPDLTSSTHLATLFKTHNTQRAVCVDYKIVAIRGGKYVKYVINLSGSFRHKKKKKAYTKGRSVHINLVLALVEHVKGRYNTGALAPIRRAQGATC